ncbi:FtsX-like permease family protein, partial [Acidobacteriota bacterium]
KIGMTNDNFGSNSITTFVQLEKSASQAVVDAKIKGFIKSKRPQSVTDLSLMPYTQMHLRAYWGYEKNAGAIQYVYIFSVIAFFVLLIACINFMNLSTARSANRAKEVGLRKVVGAFKTHLIRQFFGESIIFSFLALVIATGLVTVLLHPFSKLSAKTLSWDVTGLGTLIIGFIAITLFTGVVAGSYPALFLSSFQPSKVLKGSLKTGAASSMFRKVLVVIQFTLSVSLIIGTTVVYKQVTYMKNKQLGWDKEHVVYVSLQGESKQFFEPLKTELAKDSRILGVTGSETLPSNIGSNSSGADWDGKDPEFISLISHTRVGYDYVDTLKIEMKEGRSFSREYPSDLKSAFLVNEEVAKLMGKETAVGERFDFNGRSGTIIGVMKNFHFQSTRTKIEPLALFLEPEDSAYIMIRIPPQTISSSLNFIEDVWNRTVQGYPFEYHFLDEVFERMYRSEQRIGSLLNYFSLLAVLIACLGLFGLASFTAEQRTKEVGIRKIMGASVPNITFLLCREFFVLVILSNLLAWPAAYFIMKNWLQNYDYRTGLGAPLFFAALGIALAVALISVGFQALRAAMSDPVDSLRYE